ncbi:uncharacterized protein LOC129319890 [Prosopis cineraria]|uniref:uncharacterized protein LOC129319890 n=1 Tax=Prosopis cineraria TaxID=364024 RepID=UPI00240FFA07|nr:uncharacterized protein LOC129319890 [Prosopis cineraria]
MGGVGELFVGAALGTVFAELCGSVKDAKNRLKDFKKRLQDLDVTLQDLDPMVKDIQNLNAQLKRSDQREVERLKSLLEKGAKLVSKCLPLRGRDFIKKIYYHKKLEELDNDIIRFNNKHTQLATFRDVKLLHLKVDKLSDQIQNLQPSGSGGGGGGSGGPIYRGAPVVAPPPYTGVPRLNIPGLILLIILLYVTGAGIVKIIFCVFLLICKLVLSLLETDTGVAMIINDAGTLKTTIKNLKATMKSLAAVLEEIESSGNYKQRGLKNGAEGREIGERLRRLMEEGEKLVVKGSKIGSWNIVKNWEYQKKIVELDHTLLRFHSLHLQARLARRGHGITSENLEMQDDDSFKHAHYFDEDPHIMEGRHMETKAYESESYNMLNNLDPYQFLDYNRPVVSSAIGGFQQQALGS